MSDPFLKRYQQYFRHPDDDHDVLEVGDKAAACKNLRRALGMLDIELHAAPTDEQLYDGTLREAVRTLQTKYHHRVADGLVGHTRASALYKSCSTGFHRRFLLGYTVPRPGVVRRSS